LIREQQLRGDDPAHSIFESGCRRPSDSDEIGHDVRIAPTRRATAGQEIMTLGSRAPVQRVVFSRGFFVCIMGIDGTWRRDCMLNAISDHDATLVVEGSIQGLNLKEFFLLLSSTGLAYRRCELVSVNGTEMDVRFFRGKDRPVKPAVAEPASAGS
jgi:hypothetical protein